MDFSNMYAPYAIAIYVTRGDANAAPKEADFADRIHLEKVQGQFWEAYAR